MHNKSLVWRRVYSTGQLNHSIIGRCNASNTKQAVISIEYSMPDESVQVRYSMMYPNDAVLIIGFVSKE